MVDFESIQIGLVDGFSFGGNRYVRTLTFGISILGNGDEIGILDLELEFSDKKRKSKDEDNFRLTMGEIYRHDKFCIVEGIDDKYEEASSCSTLLFIMAIQALVWILAPCTCSLLVLTETMPLKGR